ncbi:glycosyltransferase family 2 protein [Cupriavidus sp.]|uniref:glycosyltransferase family 2 protein n=1 Tax=Cupriavidus sp. TaxID=1873897 RepID=UPI0031D38848
MSNYETQLLSLVVPFHNNGAATDGFLARVLPILESLHATHFEIVCINDGSTDDTLSRLVEAARRDGRIRVIELTRCFGKQAALTAGMDEALGDAVVPFDADLRDPPELIPTLVQCWRQGAEVVLAQCTGPGNGSYLKRFASAVCDRLHNALSDLNIPSNVGEFRLMDRAVVNAIKQLPERHRFMKGLFSWVGFNTVIVPYQREQCRAGLSNEQGSGRWRATLADIASFGSVPLRGWTYLGSCIALVSICYGLYLAAYSAMGDGEVPGVAPVIALLLFFSGVQLIGIGLVGQYIGRIYEESKGRPIYLVKRRYHTRRPLRRAGGDGKIISLVAGKRS